MRLIQGIISLEEFKKDILPLKEGEQSIDIIAAGNTYRFVNTPKEHEELLKFCEKNFGKNYHVSFKINYKQS
jgi:hypothetical protein